VTTKVAIIGSGNIGTDLMIKVKRLSADLDVGAMVGIDPDSDGLARAARMGVPTTAEGVAGLIGMPAFDEIAIVLDATSARAHVANAAALAPYGKRLIDLTPAAIGPYVVPSVNLEQHLDAGNVNMVTCGGQATIPIVAGGLVGGQEDMIVDVALDLVARRAAAASQPDAGGTPDLSAR
jgi:acetaldehyde dehydrogenase